MALKVDESEQGAWTVLRIRGELDIASATAVRQSVHGAVADGRHDLVLDLAGVFFCDSSGVNVLIATRRLMKSCGGRLRLILPARGGGGRLPRQQGARRPRGAPALRGLPRRRGRHRRGVTAARGVSGVWWRHRRTG